MGTWTIQWTETNRRGEFATKEKSFRSERSMQQFITKLEQKSNFMRVERYAFPRAEEAK